MDENHAWHFRDADRRFYARTMTGDEFIVSRMDLLRCMASNPDRDQCTQGAAATGVAEIETMIRCQAARSFVDQAERRNAVLPLWLDISKFVPALTPEGERDSPETPRLMARRAALWERPDIIALIES